jgi:hypothetical protein
VKPRGAADPVARIRDQWIEKLASGLAAQAPAGNAIGLHPAAR